MKKIFCFILSFTLLFNATVVYADIGGDIPTPFPTLIPTFPDPGEFIIRLLLPDGGQAADYISDWLEKRWSTDEDKSKDMSSDGNTVTFNSNFVNDFNTALQDKVHAMDGYVLYEPAHTLEEFPYSDFLNDLRTKYTLPLNAEELLRSKMTSDSTYFTGYGSFNGYYEEYDRVIPYCYNVHDDNRYIVSDSSRSIWRVYTKDSSGNPVLHSDSDMSYYTMRHIGWYSPDNNFAYYFGSPSFTGDNPNLIMPYSMQYAYGAPIRVFYSVQDLKNFLNKGRSYVSKLPSHIIRIPVSVVNNTPQITYNITTENKTENEIQNEYNQYFEDYVTNLYPSSGSPSPTPTPGDGGFSDGTTPTPTPPLSDGSLTPSPAPGSGVDMTETNNWLQKIYELLQKFYDSYSEFTKKISDSLENNDAFFEKVSEYLESHDRKLDEIVDAIDKLSQGKEEGEEKGCKYDYTELSGFMTKLWNDSDQKFDTMIDLLKENNAYQEKLVSTLNSIKNILKAQSVMDSFKNRSQETANKAKEKFPTSVPWDVAMVVNAMSADPKEPVFVLPVKITRLGIDEEIRVDLSTGEWEKLAKACRYMLSLLFILFMIRLTIKLFGGKGDD